jgi:serine/threonine-protein kinase
MIVTFDCPSCGASIEAELKGLKRRLVNCPSCEKGVQVPDDVGVGPGVVIGNGYRLQEKVGDSHVGEIYLATQEEEDSIVRVEILTGDMTDDEEAVTRFLQEVELLSSLKHPNLLGAIEAGQDNETYFLVTAHEPGMVSLEQYLRENSPLDAADAMRFMTSIAEVLQYTWSERKILHRDVKPQNIFITEDGQAKLSGFTIAKSSEGQSMGLTGVGFTIGTPEYMSPEQIQASEDLDWRSDLYALGVVAYECVCGELPFVENAPILLMQKHMDETPVSPSEKNGVAKPVSDVIDKFLLKVPTERGDSWEAVITDLNAVASGGAAAAAAAAAASGGGAEPEANAPAAAASGGATADADGGGGPPMGLIIGGAVVVIVIIVLVVVL